MKFKDYYKILGVDKKADFKTIKNAYRKLARKCHPDVNRDDPMAEDRFKDINEAYEVLSDPEKRRKYNLLGNSWNKVHTGTGGFKGTGFPGFGNFNFVQDLGDLSGGFGEFFKSFLKNQKKKGQFWQKKSQPKKGRDLTCSIEITLEEAYKGVEKTLHVQIQDVCPECKGQVITGKVPCSNCKSKGRVYKQKKLSVKIPSGVRDGSKVRVAGQGEIGTEGGSPGDIYLDIKLVPHKIFKLQEDDLHCEIHITITEAMSGSEISVPTINGSKVLMKVPPETRDGRMFRLAGIGMPNLKSGIAGHQFVKIKLIIPENLSPGEKIFLNNLTS